MAKDVVVTVKFDEEMLQALECYLGSKNMKVNDELTKCLLKLYTTHVPESVRKFISYKGTPGKSKLSFEEQIERAKKNKEI